MTNEAVMVRMPPDLLKLLDEYRRVQADLPSRPEAVRRIVSERLSNG
jgi:metal-responsive CopG/Arc/MetJ family transcriptional regulator